ncbi:FAGR003Wp [Eremothecium gossypii FDAG1]|nr:FAGR003Wp [Eremothecium gossypii FDAG1]
MKINGALLPSLRRSNGLKIIAAVARMSSVADSSSNTRPQADQVLKDIASYVHNTRITSTEAFKTARLCLLDTLGCGLAALRYQEPRGVIKPIVPGTIVPNGTRVLGTKYRMDPVSGAFAIGTLIRWLDYNDCWLAAEWGHPSDNLGGILAVADYMTRLSQSSGGDEGRLFTIREVLEAMIKAHEIQGILALDNAFNKVGLDHVVLVKVATTAVVSKMLNLSESQTVDALSHAFVDGQSLRTYRHAPNTGSRKSWAAGDATSRAVKIAFLVKNGGVDGIPSVLTAKDWGFYDVLLKGKPFEFKQRKTYGSYVMENVLFKISFPAEFHAQTAVEAALKVRKQLNRMGKNYQDIKSITIRTQDAAMRIIDKSGPLYNYADRDHCIQYMTAVPLIHGRLVADDYHDLVASNPAIDELRSKIYCVRDDQFTAAYNNPDTRAIPNGLTVELNDGTTLEEVVVEYPIGHKTRRAEAEPKLLEKFYRHLSGHFEGDITKVEQVMTMSTDPEFESYSIDQYVDTFCR